MLWKLFWTCSRMWFRWRYQEIHFKQNKAAKLGSPGPREGKEPRTSLILPLCGCCWWDLLKIGRGNLLSHWHPKWKEGALGPEIQPSHLPTLRSWASSVNPLLPGSIGAWRGGGWWCPPHQRWGALSKMRWSDEQKTRPGKSRPSFSSLSNYPWASSRE